MLQEPDENVKGRVPFSDEQEQKHTLLPDAKIWEEIHQVFYRGKNYYRVIDVLNALKVSTNPADYWSTMKRRVKSEGFSETRQEMVQFDLKASGDKRLHTFDYATRQTILRLLQSIPSAKAEEFKIWLAEVGEQRLQQEEITRIEAELELAREKYRKDGREDKWIEDRIINLVGRNELTDQWRNRGAIEHLHFAKLTVILHKGALGVTPDQHKQIKGLPKRENPRDHMDRVELALLSLGEATATTKHIENDTQGVVGLEQDARETARGSEAVRLITEQSLGRSIINSQNFLSHPKTKKKHLLSSDQRSDTKSQKELEGPEQTSLF